MRKTSGSTTRSTTEKASKYFDLVYQSNEILDLIEKPFRVVSKSFPPFQKQRTDTPLQYGTL